MIVTTVSLWVVAAAALVYGFKKDIAELGGLGGALVSIAVLFTLITLSK